MDSIDQATITVFFVSKLDNSQEQAWWSAPLEISQEPMCSYCPASLHILHYNKQHLPQRG